MVEVCVAKNIYKIFGENMVAVAFQSVFYLEMHQNNIYFLFFKNYFWYQRIKMIWKHKKYINLKQRKKIFFYFLKIIFDTSASKWFEKTQKIYQFEAKKKIQNF